MPEKTDEYLSKVKELREAINKVKFRLLEKYGYGVARYWAAQRTRQLPKYDEDY